MCMCNFFKHFLEWLPWIQKNICPMEQTNKGEENTTGGCIQLTHPIVVAGLGKACTCTLDWLPSADVPSSLPVSDV